MRNIKVRTVIFALLILLIALSGYLAYSNSVGNEEGLCIVDPTHSNDCSDVQNGIYGSFLGVKVCHWGLLAFALLAVVYVVASSRNEYRDHAHKLFVLMSFIGALVALYFMIVQFFVLKTLCSTCLIIDVTTILVFLLGYLESHRRKKK